MASYFSYRGHIRTFLSILFLAIVLGLDMYIYSLGQADTKLFLLLLIPALNLLNNFAPEIYGAIGKLGRFEYAAFLDKSKKEFVKFLTDYFAILPSDQKEKRSMLPLATQLETFVSGLAASPLSQSGQADTRRRPIVVMLFLIKYRDLLQIDKFEPVLSYIKTRYRTLTPAGQKEFVLAYHQLVIQDRKYMNPDAYFASASDQDYQLARLHFFDRYLKDDYIDEITALMGLQDAQIESFKSALQAVTKSGKLNLSHLRRFISERKKYRKLFIVAGDTKLPKIIQRYIMQNPHFILNWSSIANLPKVGLSRRFDIFFFSPLAPITSAQAMLAEFAKIDADVRSHPLKIYAVDPTEGASASLDGNSEFSQALRYFENSAFDTSIFGNLTFEQLMSLLEQNKISLRDIISDISVVEFSNLPEPFEKPFVEKLLKGACTTAGRYSIFNILSKSSQVASRIKALTAVPKEYTSESAKKVISGKPSLAAIRARLKAICGDINKNVSALDNMLV